MQDYKRQVVVIGGGAGGLSIASVLSRLGYKVTLVEKHENLGGDCLHYGCVPSKAFITAAKAAHDANNSKQFGINTDVRVDYQKVLNYVKSTIATIQKHDDPVRFQSYGVDVMFGNAHFVGEHMLSVDTKLIPAERFIIATGSKPAIPDIPGLDKVKYYTNETILSEKTQAKKLVILGGGAIGLEYAQAFARLGTKVVVLEATSELMMGLDRQQMNSLQAMMKQQGVEFFVNINIKNIKSENSKIEVSFDLASDHDRPNSIQGTTVIGDRLLLATGRAPQVEALGLDLIGIDYNKNGIQVDDHLRTSRKHIYAVGDVIDSPFKFTHMAEHHAGVVISNIAFRLFRKVNYEVVPRVTYTDPEWAQVGLTEKMANEKNINHQVLYYPLASLDRAIIASHTSGSIKLIVKRNKLLGASILAPHAGELIHELALAMHNKISLRKITETIHAYPTWAQMHRRAINQHFEPALFGGFSKFTVRFLQLFG